MKYVELVKTIDTASRQLLGRAAAVVNQALVLRNWLTGAYIVEFEQHGEDRASYGTRLIDCLARDLAGRAVKGISPTNLRLFREFYRAYPQLGEGLPDLLPKALAQAIRQTLSVESNSGGSRGRTIQQTASVKSSRGQLILTPKLLLQFSWSKIIELLRLDGSLKRAFYENECLKGNWSVRQLQRQIGSLLYERTGLSKNKRAVIARAHRQEPQITIEDLIRDPYVLEFTGLADVPEYHESDLEQALLNHLQSFLLELDVGFCFEARQFRVSIGNKHDYIDLLFYHRVLRCHVLLDLKLRSFTHGDAGQMNFYLNYFKDRVMQPGDQPPVGIILCSDRDHAEVEYATAGMDNKLFVSRYLTALPTAERLQRFLEADRARIEALTNGNPSQPAPRPRKPATQPARKK